MMEKKNLVWLILISVILLVLISFTIPLVLQAQHPAAGQGQNPPQPQQGADRPAQQGQQQPAPPGQDQAKHLKTIISFINIGLIIPLFIIYLGIYRELKSSFTLGLMAVIFALGMYAVTSCPLIVSLLGGRTGDIGLFQIIPDLCTTIALIILIRISLE